MATSVKNLVAQTLQCPICLNVFVDPRLLSCSHTYCKDCLKQLSNSGSQSKGRKITCPVCRKITKVPNSNVNLLQCNYPIKSLIEDVKNQTQACTVCRGNEKPLAITYCQECDDYMCDDCHKTHDKWDKFAGHEVVKVDGIISGVVSKKKRRKCKKHKSEDEEYFCDECKRFVCFRCGVMEHSQAGHKVLDGKAHDDEQKKKIGELRGRADVKMSKNNQYIAFVKEQQAQMKHVLEKLSREIEQACEESIHQLQEKRDHLIKECTRRIEEFNKELQSMRDVSKLRISQIKEMSDLVENGLKMPLEGVALTAHGTLCQKLEEVLGKSDPDYERPLNTTLQGNRVAFQQTRRGVPCLNEINLGEICHVAAAAVAVVESPIAATVVVVGSPTTAAIVFEGYPTAAIVVVVGSPTTAAIVFEGYPTAAIVVVVGSPTTAAIVFEGYPTAAIVVVVGSPTTAAIVFEGYPTATIVVVVGSPTTVAIVFEGYPTAAIVVVVGSPPAAIVFEGYPTATIVVVVGSPTAANVFEWYPTAAAGEVEEFPTAAAGLKSFFL
ncbi:E3 ubiquitin-protein ligase TRIM56-like [Diadema antillarum]|uniref:E3 ubiquitin-protein ligase TRIM56-like n=1 Tax=Diadema antillarum TaxID=105358 RepID=UPI003A86EE3F